MLGLLQGERTPKTRAMFRKLLPAAIEDTPVTINGKRGFRLSGKISFASFLRGGGVLESLTKQAEPTKPDSQPHGGGPNPPRPTLTFPIAGTAKAV